MLFREKNDGGVELHITEEERIMLYTALRFYSAYGIEKNVLEKMPEICEMLGVLHCRGCD